MTFPESGDVAWVDVMALLLLPWSALVPTTSKDTRACITTGLSNPLEFNYFVNIPSASFCLLLLTGDQWHRALFYFSPCVCVWVCVCVSVSVRVCLYLCVCVLSLIHI